MTSIPSLSYGFLDGNRDGAPDLYRVKPYGAQDLLIEYARSSRDFLQCGVSQAVVPDGAAVDGEILVADYDGDAHPDLWVIDTSRNPDPDSGAPVCDRVPRRRNAGDRCCPQRGHELRRRRLRPRRRARPVRRPSQEPDPARGVERRRVDSPPSSST